MSKACDVVERSFGLPVLKLFGIPLKCIKLVKTCICNPSVGISINGEIDGSSIQSDTVETWVSFVTVFIYHMLGDSLCGERV